jgi:hypothetical protein
MSPIPVLRALFAFGLPAPVLATTAIRAPTTSAFHPRAACTSYRPSRRIAFRTVAISVGTGVISDATRLKASTARPGGCAASSTPVIAPASRKASRALTRVTVSTASAVTRPAPKSAHSAGSRGTKGRAHRWSVPVRSAFASVLSAIRIVPRRQPAWGIPTPASRPTRGARADSSSVARG